MTKTQYEAELNRLSIELGNKLLEKGVRIACAESCTGGLLAKALTDVAGSSAYFDRGYVAYSNEAKQQMLNVDPCLFDQYGAVSEPVVKQMASGALKLTSVDLVIAMSGITGPNGGTPEKPVGTVWFCWLGRGNKALSVCRRFTGDRETIRLQSASFAIKTLLADFI